MSCPSAPRQPASPLPPRQVSPVHASKIRAIKSITTHLLSISCSNLSRRSLDTNSTMKTEVNVRAYSPRWHDSVLARTFFRSFQIEVACSLKLPSVLNLLNHRGNGVCGDSHGGQAAAPECYYSEQTANTLLKTAQNRLFRVNEDQEPAPTHHGAPNTKSAGFDSGVGRPSLRNHGL